MIEILIGGFVGFVALALGLALLILLPLMLIGLAFKALLFVILLPFRLIGLLVGAVATVGGLLFKGLWAILSVVLGIATIVFLVMLFPVGLLLLFGLAVWGLVKLLAPGVAVGAV